MVFSAQSTITAAEVVQFSATGFGVHMGMLAIDFGAIHCGQCVQFRCDSLQRMLANSARFIAVNAYNFGAIRCGQCLKFWRDSLQRNFG